MSDTKTDKQAQAASKVQQKPTSLEGIGIAAGVAIGTAFVIDSRIEFVPEYRISATDVDNEIERFLGAVEKSLSQVAKLKERVGRMTGAAGEELGYLLDAHTQMLSGSRLIRGVEDQIRDKLLNAEAAVQTEIEMISQEFAAIPDAYIAARVQDVREVGARIIRNLTETPFHGFTNLPDDTIIVAHEVTPADTALMDPDNVEGFIAEMGGAEGHTAIMARSLGIVAVVGVEDAVHKIRTGDTVVFDGVTGRVVVNPDESQMAAFEAKRDALIAEQRSLDQLRDLSALTGDGESIQLQANMELPIEMDAALRVGADGIGLLRSEFMFMNRETLPNEEEQYQILKSLVEGMDGRTITVRTLDVGADKLVESLDHEFDTSANPALGLRGIRLALKEPAILDMQLAAILRAGAHGPVRILLPMITNIAEVQEVRARLNKTAADLREKKIDIADTMPPLGIMIEVPAAALAADNFAPHVDFFSIGTNDLTMYTLAIDRGNEQVAHLFDPLHPAVLRLIQISTAAANRAGIPISLCGEMAGDPRYTMLLLGLGLTELSMTPTAVPRVKRRIRGLDMTSIRKQSIAIMEQNDAEQIGEMLDDFNARL